VTASEVELETLPGEKKWGKRETMPSDHASRLVETGTFGD
jgi:hypothetical protein